MNPRTLYEIYKEHGTFYGSKGKENRTMNWNEKQQQFVFENKESANTAKAAILDNKDIRLSGRISVRRSLPEFRHSISPGFSLFATGLGLMDSNNIAAIAKSASGFKRVWGRI